MDLQEIDEQLRSIADKVRFLRDCINGGLRVCECEYLLDRVTVERERLMDARRKLLFTPCEDFDAAMGHAKEQVNALTIRATS